MERNVKKPNVSRKTLPETSHRARIDALDPPDRTRIPYGRLTTTAGIQYLYDRAYVIFAEKRPGQPATAYEDLWPEDVVEEICFGDERERTRRGPSVRDPWTETAGWCKGRWRNRAPRFKRAAA
jgi:hypothetical protein